MKRSVTLLALVAALAPMIRAASGPNDVRLWSGAAPGEQVPFTKPESDVPNSGDIRKVTDVSVPVLTPFLATKEKNTGSAIIIAPGGAYQFLSWTHEGTELAQRFNRDGVNAFVLKYRVPTRSFDPGNSLALMDAQRAVSTVRSHAAEWGVNPKRIGFLGISAGGHLAVNLISRSLEDPAKRAYPSADAIDQVSYRPDFCVLLYPGGILDKQDSTKMAPEVKVAKETPPTFIAVADNDNACSECSARYYLELKRARVPSELHVFNGGSHGFGMRPSAGVAATWPDRCVDWMRARGLLTPEK
jgi:acetyl esterase/lipase